MALNEPMGAVLKHPASYPAMVCDDLATALPCARADLAMTLMPWGIGNTDTGLVQVMQLPVQDYAPIRALTHPDLRRNALVSGFLRFIADRFAARAPNYWMPMR